MDLTGRIRNKKTLSVFLSAVLALNTCAMIKISTHGSGTPDSKERRSDIVNRASAYLDSRKAGDNSYGDSRTINDTAYALKAYRKAGKSGHEESLQWLSEKVSFSNTDMTARLAAVSGKQEYLGNMKAKQNQDGGFGLYPDYASDVLDSVLVLEAINETGYSGGEISGAGICSYLFSTEAPDGGYAYAESNESDPELTAMVVYSAGKFLTAGNYDTSVLEAPLSYISGNISDSYTDSGIDKTIYKYLAYLAAGEKFDAASIVSELGKAERPDGSFAGSVKTTALAIELLSALDLENSVSVNTFSTQLSSAESKAGSAAPIKAVTDIGYVSNYDAELDLRFTVYSDGNPIYENVSKASLPAAETSASIEAGEFRINDPGKEVYALAELLRGDVLVKSQRIDITVSEDDTVYSTEVSQLAVSTDKYTAFTGTDAEVSITATLLYATNIDNNADIRTRVLKDGKEIASRTDKVELVPEKNSVSPEPLIFSADTSKPGKYTIESVCLKDGKEVIKGETEFNVIEAPVIDDEPEDGAATQFEVTWFGPILSEYYVYAGNEKEISAGAEINYYSNGRFTGKAELAVYRGEELITENSFDVELEKGTLTYYEGKAEFPVYKNEDQLTFHVKDAGEYVVTGKLYDSEGNLIKEGQRKLIVVDKPVQDLIMNSSEDPDQENMINITWNDISNDAESYSYQLNRRTNGEKWEPRSIWNEEEHIRVLNVYPYQPFLVDWMNTTISDTELPAGKGIFDIDPVHITAFNSDPASYLYNPDGSWKCDVIFFGASDCNSGYDMSNAAAAEIQKFIDSGRGVLFGHDTMNRFLGHVNFNSFDEQTGLHVSTSHGTYRTTSVSVVKIGTLTNYPWTIRGDLTVPNTHTSGQFITNATEWITLNTQKEIDSESGGIDGFYLCTHNNLGMIQTGDSTGQATDDERKVIANTLFYLYQISQQTTAKDASFYDIDAPDKPELISSDTQDGKVNVRVKTKDNPTDYEYYITATPESPDSDSVISNVSKHTAFSDLAGFVVKVSGSSEEDPGLIEYNETRDQILDIVPADNSGTAVLTAVPTDFTQPQYIHIFAVDNAGNVSEEYIMPFAENDITANIITDKKLYSYGDKVEIDADTLSAPFGRTADMKIEITDESGLTAAELVSEKDKTLSAGEKLESEAEWTIPADTTGRFNAVIRWMKDDTVIATAESVFKVANDTSIVNTVVSDKKKYLVNEPVNLDHAVFNQSQGMTENDLELVVKVYNTADGSEAASFEHSIGMVEPSGNTGCNDAILPDTLMSGSYRVKAAVMQDGAQLSEDEAEFEVTEDVTMLSGKLDLSGNGGKGQAAAEVTNPGSADIENAELSVTVYKEGSEEAVFSFTETASIKAGEKISLSREFDLPVPPDGRYSGVLKAVYNGNTSDLDYDGFDVVSEITPETTTSVTTAAAATTTSTTKKAADPKTDSPKTGDGQIPGYMWIISILSIAGLAVIKITGGSRNENE